MDTVKRQLMPCKGQSNWEIVGYNERSFFLMNYSKTQDKTFYVRRFEVNAVN